LALFEYVGHGLQAVPPGMTFRYLKVEHVAGDQREEQVAGVEPDPAAIVEVADESGASGIPEVRPAISDVRLNSPSSYPSPAIPWQHTGWKGR
jgi:hypothetical protein